MKNNIAFALCLLLNASLLISCSKTEIEKVLPEANASFTDYNLKLESSIDVTTVGTTDFIPKGSFVSNGKIYIANNSANRLEVIDAKTGNPVGFIKDWTVNGNQESLNAPTDVCVSNGRIYVSSKNSYRVDVFDEKTLAFISCIGTGDYWSDYSMLEPYSIRISGNKAFVLTRDPQGTVRVYNTEEINSDTYKKVQTKAFLSLELQSDQWDAAYSMEISGNQLYVADRTNKRILVYDIDSVDFKNADLAQKTNAVKPSFIIDLKDKTVSPTGLSFFKDFMMVSYNDSPRVDVLNKTDGNVVSTFSSVDNIPLKSPERIFVKNDTLLVSDSSNKMFHISTIHEMLIKEFD